MKRSLMISLAAASAAVGQFEDIRPEDRPKLDDQALRVFEVVEPILERAAASTVEVRVKRKRIGYGTVVGPEQVVSKWSDVNRVLNSLTCRGEDGRLFSARVVGVYEDDDLALLDVPGLEAPAIEFADSSELELGKFLALARPDGEAGGIGVVSVLPRSLREGDRAFLGVQMDIDYVGLGVKIDRVEPGTGASDAGLRRGDVVMGINGVDTNGNFELSTVLQRMSPGESVLLRYRRGESEKSVEVVLGGRPDEAKIPMSRMETMNRMGGHRYSRVVEDFARVIQTDMQIQPEDCGAPVVDLEGRVVGIALARAGRIKTFILPAETVSLLMAGVPEEGESEGVSLKWSQVDEKYLKQWKARRKMSDDELRRHIEEMEELERGVVRPRRAPR